jgi:hypothetical protein
MTLMTLKIVTNNPYLIQDEEMPLEVYYTEGTPLDVLDEIEMLLQQGFRLLSAPLPPNVPLMRAPYRSLILAVSDLRYDIDGIEAIRKAKARLDIERTVRVAPKASDFAELDRIMLLQELSYMAAFNT